MRFPLHAGYTDAAHIKAHTNKRTTIRSSLILCGTLLIGMLAAAAEGQTRKITFRVQVPTDTPTVYLTGNAPETGSWQPRGVPLSSNGVERTATLMLPTDASLEYKFTLGSWDTEALTSSGAVPANHRLIADKDQDVSHTIIRFKQSTGDLLEDWKRSGVIGRLEHWRDVPSRFLTATRNVSVWLPPDYDDQGTNRFGVIYMHDGQNLFDPRLAFTGTDWGVDEAMMRCTKSNSIPPMIVVGIWSTPERLREYSPWHQGTNYARFLIEELMPRVNQRFRTRTGPGHTAVMGSSMGGLISFWLCWKHPETFGRAGCLSSALMWNGSFLSPGSDTTPYLEREIAAGAKPPANVRLYFDYGTDEGFLGAFERSHKPLKLWLTTNGLKDGVDFCVREFIGAKHNEAAWRARLDEPLQFLFTTQTNASRP